MISREMKILIFKILRRKFCFILRKIKKRDLGYRGITYFLTGKGRVPVGNFINLF